MGWLPQADVWAVSRRGARARWSPRGPAMLRLPRSAYIIAVAIAALALRAGRQRRAHRHARLGRDLRHRPGRLVRGQERVLARAAGVVLRVALLPRPLRRAGAGGAGQRRRPSAGPAALRPPDDADDARALRGAVHRRGGRVRAVDLCLGSRPRAGRADRAHRGPARRRRARAAALRHHVGRRGLRRAGRRGGGAAGPAVVARAQGRARWCWRSPRSARGRCWPPGAFAVARRVAARGLAERRAAGGRLRAPVPGAQRLAGRRLRL